MKRTIKTLTSSIVELATEVVAVAERLDIDDPGITGAESVIYLRDAQRAMNSAIDQIRLSVSQAADRQTSKQ